MEVRFPPENGILEPQILATFHHSIPGAYMALHRTTIYPAIGRERVQMEIFLETQLSGLLIQDQVLDRWKNLRSALVVGN